MRSTSSLTPGWHMLVFYGSGNTITERAAYRAPAGWLAAPGQARPIVMDSNVITATPMRVADEDEVILKADDPRLHSDDLTRLAAS